MERAHFDWRSSKWASVSEEEGNRWIKELERLRVENVERTLRQRVVGSAAEIWMGSVLMTKGFAEDWLAAEYAKREERDIHSRRWQNIWTVLSSVLNNATVIWTAIVALAAFIGAKLIGIF
jgi:hypothetical protein